MANGGNDPFLGTFSPNNPFGLKKFQRGLPAPEGVESGVVPTPTGGPTVTNERMLRELNNLVDVDPRRHALKKLEGAPDQTEGLDPRVITNEDLVAPPGSRDTQAPALNPGQQVPETEMNLVQDTRQATKNPPSPQRPEQPGDPSTAAAPDRNQQAPQQPDAGGLTQNTDDETKDRARRNQGVLEQLVSEPGAARFLFDLGTGILSQGLVGEGESATGQIGTAAQSALQNRREIEQQQAQEQRQQRRLDLQRDRLEQEEEARGDRQEFKRDMLEKRLGAQRDRLLKKLEKKNQGLDSKQAIDLMSGAVDAYQNEREAVCSPVRKNQEGCKQISSAEGKRDFISDYVRGALNLSGDFQINKTDANKIVKEGAMAKVRSGEPVSGRVLKDQLGLEVPEDELDSMFTLSDLSGNQEQQEAGGQQTGQGQEQQQESQQAKKSEGSTGVSVSDVVPAPFNIPAQISADLSQKIGGAIASGGRSAVETLGQELGIEDVQNKSTAELLGQINSRMDTVKEATANRISQSLGLQ